MEPARQRPNTIAEKQPGQESVWDYPRPPRVEDSQHQIKVVFNGVVIAETQRAKRVLETSHPPVYYIPPEDVRLEYLTVVGRATYCEFKGTASYYTVSVGSQTEPAAAWFYPEPSLGYEAIRNYIAFYCSKMEACYVDGEQVISQAGDFYGGWITKDIVGPFKGEPGTWSW